MPIGLRGCRRRGGGFYERRPMRRTQSHPITSAFSFTKADQLVSKRFTLAALAEDHPALLSGSAGGALPITRQGAFFMRRMTRAASVT